MCVYTKCISTFEILDNILDAEGRLIKTQIIPSSNEERTYEEVEISDLPAGVYMIHVTQDDFKEVKKLIVVR